jgi:hypothetical protein
VLLIFNFLLDDLFLEILITMNIVLPIYAIVSFRYF